MALKTHEQFLHALEKADRPLILLHERANVDDFSSAFGVAALLAKMQKPVEIATTGGSIPRSLQFLKTTVPVRGDLPNIRKLTLHLNVNEAKIDELSYDVKDGELNIHLLPKSGHWSEKDVRVTTEQYRYDLVITIGVSELEALGSLYKQYADFLFQTPIINIDHDTRNEHFGQMNLVDIKAVACSEVCHELFRNIDQSLIDEEVATFFLCGMIAKTKSFRNENVTPKTLKIASNLIAAGARRDEIVEHLYKTRTMETLRLWGRALARLKSSQEGALVWTLLTRQDFVQSGAKDDSIENVVEELMMSSPNAKIGVLFYEKKDGKIEAIVHALRPHDALYLGAPFRASGTREEAVLSLKDDEIVSAEKAVIRHIEKQI